VGSAGSLIATLLELYLFILFARLILDYVRMFARNWRPRGLMLPIAEIIYALTDKPLSFIRRYVPPLRLGAVALDLSFIVLFFVVQFLANALR
jgi:YggT family protein